MAMQRGMTVRDSGGRIAGTKGLTEKQQAFVVAMVANGGNQTHAAEAAGYADPKSAGWHLAQIPGVQAALHAARQKAISSIATAGLDLLGQVVRGEVEAAMGIRVDASKFVLGLAGHVQPKDQPDAPKDSKPLEDMSISEMEDYVKEARERLKVIGAGTLDAPAVEPAGPQAVDIIERSPVSPRQGGATELDGEPGEG